MTGSSKTFSHIVRNQQTFFGVMRTGAFGFLSELFELRKRTASEAVGFSCALCLNPYPHLSESYEFYPHICLNLENFTHIFVWILRILPKSWTESWEFYPHLCLNIENFTHNFVWLLRILPTSLSESWEFYLHLCLNLENFTHIFCLNIENFTHIFVWILRILPISLSEYWEFYPHLCLILRILSTPLSESLGILRPNGEGYYWVLCLNSWILRSHVSELWGFCRVMCLSIIMRILSWFMCPNNDDSSKFCV